MKNKNLFFGFNSDPVKRDGAQNYILIILVSSAATVLLLRLYLQLANYPQLGGGPFQIAHLLWGGLLLFAASLLPLIIANRWVYRVVAFASGIGSGLFIDEVGKFITRTNNYFYPGAAPLIYAFFLSIILLYVRVRRKKSKDARTELYHALDAMEEALDHDLDIEEHAHLIQQLERIAKEKTHPDYARLAQELLNFLRSPDLALAPAYQTTLERYKERGEILEKRLLSKRLYKALLIAGCLIFAYQAFFDFKFLLDIATSNKSIQQSVNILVKTGRLTNGSLLPWVITRLVLQAAGGIILSIAAFLFIFGRQKLALAWAYFGIIFHLSVINLLVFYLDQFRAAGTSLIEFGYLLALIRYRRLYIFPLLKQRGRKNN